MSKSKKRIAAIALALLLVITFGMFFFGHANPTTASAQAEYHWLKFSYVKYDVKDDGTKKKLESSNGSYGGGSIKSGPYTTTTLGLKCYKSDFDMSKWMYRYDLDPKEGLTFSDISIAVSSGGFGDWEIEAYDSTGRKMGYSKNTPLNLNYPEGHYTIKFTAKGSHYDYGSDKGYYLIEAESSLIVDYTAPYIEGADPEGQERWVTVGHTIHAVDATSEIKFFYKSTEEGKFYGYDYQVDSYTFKEGDKNGYYGFYCIDWSTNYAEKRYVYFDGVKPTGTILTEDGEIESGSTVKKAFSFFATDDYSGIEELQYKTPSSSAWKSYTEGSKIPASSEGGTYYFRCADKAGNENIYSVVLESSSGGSGDNEGDHGGKDGDGNESGGGDENQGGDSNGGGNNGGNGNEGDNGNEGGGTTPDPEQPTPPAHTTHNYVKQSEKEATCTEDGYIDYKCGECGESYRETLTKLGHSYTSSRNTTCTGETTTYTCSRCGYKYSESTGSGSGHSYVSTTTAATCTSSGYTTYKCSKCGDSYQDKATNALGHNYSTTKKTTCTGETTVYTCSRCNYSYSESSGDGYGHSYTAKTTAATCTSSGYTVYTCSRCGDSYRDMIAQPLGHNYTTSRKTTCAGETTIYTCTRCSYSYSSASGEGYGHAYIASITEATCTKGGYTVYQCSRCGDSYRDNETQPLGHNFTVVQNSSCTSGTTVYSCSRCGESKVESTGEGTGHIYVASIISPTCTEGGYTIYKCTRCGDNYRDNETAALEHNYVSSVVAATCEEGGYTLHECSRCGENYQNNATQPLGHNFVTTTELPTCTEFGKTVYTCQVCGFEKKESDGTYPIGHSNTSVIVRAATCISDGLRESTCDNCGEKVESRISAAGHRYEITDSSSTNGNTRRIYTCSSCGDSYTQELGNQYEQVANYVEYLFDQYSPYMFWVLLATAGLWSIAMGVAIIIAVKNEDKVKARKMLVNYLVGLVVIAVIVVACPYLIRGIAALVT